MRALSHHAMLQRVRFVLEQVVHDLRVGFLMRPGLIIASLATLGAVLPIIEARSAAASAVLVGLPLFHGEPATAQLVLATIAASMMTVVSIVYSVLVMALSLASMQFSPRIVSRFIRDAASQTTLGVFVGTFLYCLLVLPSVRAEPAFVPTLSVSLALILALASLAWLVYFIHHIARNIQANHIVDLIATETEAVIDEVFPQERAEGELDAPPRSVRPEAPSARVSAPVSGYVQLIDEQGLGEIAEAHGLHIHALKGVGDYVPKGGSILALSPPDRATEEAREACADAFDIGPIRTMQQDVEFGIRQIVDIALKAISPAVNDPSTAVTCIDHLSRLLARLVRRTTAAPPGRLELRRPTFVSALDLAVNQIRQYGRSDIAVSIRLLRALSDIAECASDPQHLARIQHHAELVASGCAEHHPEDRTLLSASLRDLEELIKHRLAPVSSRISDEGPRS